MIIMIAIPHIPEDETEAVDEWDMLMRDLRDDVPDVHLLPACADTNPEIRDYDGVPCFVYRLDVSDDLGEQLLASAYADCNDLIIEKA